MREFGALRDSHAITPAGVVSAVSLSGIWRWILPASFVLSHAALYELLEWAAAILFGGDLGQAYLGTQGDPWDAHQDILLALLGNMVAMPMLWLSRKLQPAVSQGIAHPFMP